MFGRFSVVAVLLMPFLVLAILGLILSLISHTAALLGLSQPLGSDARLLHIDLVVVCVPALVVAICLTPDRKQRGFPWDLIVRRCAPWMWLMTFVFGVYALVNYLIVSALDPPTGITLSTDVPPGVFRGSSGDWMAGYSFATAVLYAAIVELVSDSARQ
jgi:hypothetical protein